MYISHDILYRIFTIEVATAEFMVIDEEMFKKVAWRLFEQKVITQINIDNVESFTKNGKHIARFDIHVCNTTTPSAIRLTSIQKALQSLLGDNDGHAEMNITVN